MRPLSVLLAGYWPDPDRFADTTVERLSVKPGGPTGWENAKAAQRARFDPDSP